MDLGTGMGNTITKKATLDWDVLDRITKKWLSETLRELRKRRPNTSASDEPFCRLAEYCLIACSEYRDAAFDAFRQRRFYAGLNSLRPILEHAIHLWWCGSDKRGVSGRLRRWEKEAARQHRNVATEWRDLKPRGSQEWQDRDKGVISWQHELDIRSDVYGMPSIEKMTKTLPGNATAPQAVAKFYSVYRELCQSSHATLDLDGVFEPRGSALVTHLRREMPWMGPVEAVNVPLALVSAVHAYFGWQQPDLGEGYQQAKQMLVYHYQKPVRQPRKRAGK